MSERVSAPRSALITFGVLLVISMLLVGAIIFPLWKPMFLAAVLAAVFQRWNEWLARKLGGRPRVASGITTLCLIVVVLVPMIILGVVIVGEAINAVAFVKGALQRGGIDELVSTLPKAIEAPIKSLIELIPTDGQGTVAAGGKIAAGLASQALAIAANLAFSLGILLVAFFAFLLSGRKLIDWVKRISPMPETGELLTEARKVSGFVLRSTFITSVLQGIAATIGYTIASVPNGAFFGLLTFFSSFIPTVGTSLVALPLVGLLALNGQVWQPIFVLAWNIVIVGTIDNLIKPMFIREGMPVSGLTIFFSLVGGLIMFGGIGLLVGPLALTFFMSMIRFGQRDYLSPLA
jgi:predicted PurR-regulated permease PerM